MYDIYVWDFRKPSYFLNVTGILVVNYATINCKKVYDNSYVPLFESFVML